MTPFAIRRSLSGVFVVVFLRHAPALAGDLVDHNGFEPCWTQAASKAHFLGAMRTALDGVASCVPQVVISDTFTACYTAACPGAVVGCPVTTHADPFAGTFAAGTSEFSATGSADSIVVPIMELGCSITISNVSLTYTLDYTMQADGNEGLYTASLDQSILAVGPGYNATGSLTACQLVASTLGPLIVEQVETDGAAGVLALETPATVGESVCPLTP